MSEFALEDFFPPVAKGETLRAIPAEIHFATFVAALMETLENGMEGVPLVYKQRVATLRSELEQVQKLVEVYLRRHFNTLAEHSVKVRQLLLSNMNIGLHEGMEALAVQGGRRAAAQQQQQPQALPPLPLQQQRTLSAAAAGAGGTRGGGAGGSRPNAVRFSRNHVPAARGGGGRGNGGSN
eukprot:jgi/Undpi1/3046/HiC_scaffold_15.g06422.m1